ncbi:hypothetical protein [Mobilicoccus massiliensis]|uniref:hypothetical protein n=1 Tax=Mobilicoccus massiliensis TaxID=1522310 RepID=UPI00058C7960|nr:hypothetical protein [Mobilicoccus massiliensis]
MSTVAVMDPSIIKYLLNVGGLPLPMKLALVAAKSGGTFKGDVEELRQEVGPYKGVAPWREDTLAKNVRIASEQGFLTEDSTLSSFTITRGLIEFIELDDAIEAVSGEESNDD